MSDTLYKKGDYVTNKSINGSVYVIHIVDVSGAGSGAGVTGYVIKGLHNHHSYVAVDDHILNYYYKRIPEEDIPYVLLESIVE